MLERELWRSTVGDAAEVNMLYVITPSQRSQGSAIMLICDGNYLSPPLDSEISPKALCDRAEIRPQVPYKPLGHTIPRNVQHNTTPTQLALNLTDPDPAKETQWV